MPEILIVIPVLGRPQRAQPVYESATEATDVPHRVLFVTSPGDDEERDACVATGAEVLIFHAAPGPGDWARKIEWALAATSAEDGRWIFTGADDLIFHEGWGSAALALGYIDEAGVVGTNDLGNASVKAGKHSTHSLVRRSYIEECGMINGPGLFHLGYSHNFADTEMVETAKARGCFSFAAGSVVEHAHPNWGKAPTDDTYALGMRDFSRDRALFQRRRKLWQGLTSA